MVQSESVNCTLEDIAREIVLRDNFAICGHVSPDGDCLGSQLALYAALRQMGKSARLLFAQEDPQIEGFSFLPGFEEIKTPSQLDGQVDCFITVDASNGKRIQDARAIRDAADFRILIDHHNAEPREAEMSFTDPTAAACCLLIWELGAYLPISRAGDFALCCYTGLMTDTGRFAFTNADARAFAAAAQMVEGGADPALASSKVFDARSLASLLLERAAIGRMRLDFESGVAVSWLTSADFERFDARKPDSEGLVNVLRSIEGIRAAALLREQDGHIRVSLRSELGVDVSGLAAAHGGGGHAQASGCTMEGDIAFASRAVFDELRALAGGLA